MSKSCSALCDSMDCCLPGSSVGRITQARLLERLPFPPPGDFPHPGENGIELASHVLAGRLPSTVPPGKILLFV